MLAALEHVVIHAHRSKSSHTPLRYMEQTVNTFTSEHLYRYATLLLGVRVCLRGVAYRHLGEIACYLCQWVCHRRAVKQEVASMRQLGEVVHTVPLVYQPTQLPGGTMTRPEGALLPLTPYTVYDGACLQLRV